VTKVSFREQSLIILSIVFLSFEEVSIEDVAEADSGIFAVGRLLMPAMTEEPEPPKPRVAEPRRRPV
jgi:hypothetical protein